MSSKIKLETLEQFRCRTEGFMGDSLPKEGSFRTNDNLIYKVNEQGALREYCGNTIVFLLKNDDMIKLEKIQRCLNETCSGMLAEPLRRETFHITLHDLVNGVLSRDLSQQIEKIRNEAVHKLNEVRKEIGGDLKIRMRSTCLFNMVNTSVVLGFQPADEDSCQNIMELYEKFQDIVYLPYPLTPHVTMAYYKPGTYGYESIEKLDMVIQQVNCLEKIELELNISQLVYQEFTDMNHYFL